MSPVERTIISYEVLEHYTDESTMKEMTVVLLDVSCCGIKRKEEKTMTENNLKKIIKAGKYLA